MRNRLAQASLIAVHRDHEQAQLRVGRQRDRCGAASPRACVATVDGEDLAVTVSSDEDLRSRLHDLVRVFGTREGFLPPNPRIDRFLNTISLEIGLGLGVFLVLSGLAAAIYAVAQWHAAGFGELTATRMLRLTLPSACALMLGVEAIFASFFIGLLQIHRR